MFSSDTKYLIKLKLTQWKLPRTILGGSLLISGIFFYHIRNYYLFSKVLGKYEKLHESDILEHHTSSIYRGLKQKREALLSTSKNLITESFLLSSNASTIAKLYRRFSSDDTSRIRYKNEDNDTREGNLLVLKAPVVTDGIVQKKGVLYLQYNNSLSEFVRLYNLTELYRYFSLVFEPSSWGYTDLGLELLLHENHNVYVMAQDEIDFELVKLLDPRLVPIRAGAGDWINLDVVHDPKETTTKFDVCMVGSWRKLKNHKLLFQQLSKLGKGLKIALVGYCWENRTAASIRAEQKKYYPDSLVSIFESVPHEYVFRVLAQSKVALMLSEREGANRGVYEALASNTPVVILKNNRGVNKDLFVTGCAYSTEASKLAETVRDLLSDSSPYDVREKLIQVSGAKNTWNKIGDALNNMDGINLPEEPIIVSTPNLKYLTPTIKMEMDPVYNLLKTFLRPL
jgi:glycosyltransferase involved in cell wall biosynthesis